MVNISIAIQVIGIIIIFILLYRWGHFGYSFVFYKYELFFHELNQLDLNHGSFLLFCIKNV